MGKLDSLGKPSPIAILVILIAGVAAISSSATLIRLALQAAAQKGLGISLLIAAMRLSMATLLLLPISYARKLRRGYSAKRSPSTKPVSSPPINEHSSSSSNQDLPPIATDSLADSLADSQAGSLIIDVSVNSDSNSPADSKLDASLKSQSNRRSSSSVTPKLDSSLNPQPELTPTITNPKIKQLPTPALLLAIASGVLLAAQFCTWTTSLSYTSIAASTTLVTTNPIWTALIGWVWGKERLNRSTWIGMAIALVGGVIIAQSDSGNAVGSNPALGNLLALLGAIAMSLYLHLAQRAQQQGLSLNAHITIAYGTAALVLLPLPLLTQTYYWHLEPQFYGYVLLLAIAPQLIGHTSLNWSLRWTSPTIVAVIILCEPVLASLLGYVFLAEAVAIQTIVGAALIMAGVAMSVLSIWKLSSNPA
jgi:drug/metabolite transporter (DMT)-like permease